MSRLTVIIIVIFTMLAGAALGVWLALREPDSHPDRDTSGSEVIVPNAIQAEDKNAAYADELELLYREADSGYYDEDLYNELEVDTDNQYDDPYDDPYYDEDS